MSGALLLGLLACERGELRASLPDGAVALVTLESGVTATVYVEIHRERPGPQVRAALGRYEIAPELPSATLAPDESTHHDGPGAGFHLRRREDRLELLRPRGDEARWLPVLKGVRRLERVRWINTARLSSRDLRTLDTRLKEVIPLDILPGEAAVDGDLSEWEGAAARPVERSSQVLAGMPSWSGPRDASFGLAARETPEGVVLAVRIRDDRHVPGEDRLEILTSSQVIRLPLPASARAIEGGAWTAAFSEPDWLGQGLELRLEGTTAAALLRAPPVVQLVDLDPGEEEARLGSASNPALSGLAAAE